MENEFPAPPLRSDFDYGEIHDYEKHIMKNVI